MGERTWWWCLRHARAEQGPGCPNDQRLGPYETRDEAEGAMRRTAERTVAWDEDPRWRRD